ncbi:MAG: prepilin-type N-terminal cleavage/methylation domain-containing protein [Candidatus Omnitrophica bacterium]|nr:prepilin-type N-terminal cleavage/methylation domain-containing protein [Candidatus Omnitrophota bacterium]
MRANKGVTLIELIIAMSIIFVLAATAVSYTRPYPVLKLRSVARQLGSDIAYAHELAVTRRVPHGIYFDTANEQYYLYKQVTSDKVVSPITGTNMIISYPNIDQYKGINLISTNFGYNLEFNAAGEPCDAYGNLLTTAAVITLQYSSDFSTTVQVEPETGRVSLQ